MIGATLVYKEILPPDDRKCDCGHFVSETFKRESGNEEPTKFFKLSGVISGVYCEPCLIVANWLAKRK